MISINASVARSFIKLMLAKYNPFCYSVCMNDKKISEKINDFQFDRPKPFDRTDYCLLAFVILVLAGISAWIMLS